MQITHKNDYTLLTSDETTFDDFLKNFKEKHSTLEEKHVIIQLSDNLNIVEKNILLFLDYSAKHTAIGTTFVVICKNVDIDAFPENFNVVPTLQEAEDVLEMENIERDLGF